MSDQDRTSKSSDAARTGKSEKEGEEDDLRTRFPDPDADARLQVPRGDALPQVPAAEFRRPTLPEVDPLAKNPKLRHLPGELRGMGAASTVGLTLVISIAIGAGLGWLVDKFLLRDPATPWGLIVGFLIGVASGFLNLVRVANQLNRDDDR